MKRQTQTLLYHLLPVAFWLLAIGGIVIWEMYHLPFTIYHFVPALAALLSVTIVRHIPRHTDSIQQCFQVAVFLGIASYWLPSVVFLIIPIWIYLIWKSIFNLRSFLATFIGLGLVAVWMVVLEFLHLTHYTLHLTPYTLHHTPYFSQPSNTAGP
jgi:hypothetical protein